MKLTKQQMQSIPFQYAQDVRNGNIVVGLRIKQAVDRFYSWIDNADADGFYLDHQKGMMVINFFETILKHTKGKSAGKPFLLSLFQQFTLYNVMAWMQKKETGDMRRINNVYEKVGKKNGKTAVMAGLNLFHLSFDLEQGAECYIGATKEEQAKLCFNQACEFITKSPLLQQLGFRVLQREIKFTPTNSFSKPLGGDSKTQDGINSSLSIIDEYHAHRDDSVKENLESSMASRRQPLVYTITTAGVNVAGVCKNFEDQCISILEGQLKDDHFFVMIHDLDEGDDWEDPQNWIKANPNLGVTVSMDFLLKEYTKAKNQPSKAPNFKTKHLNMWVDAPQIWIPTETWNQNEVKKSFIISELAKIAAKNHGVNGVIEDSDINYEALFIKKANQFGSYAATDLSTTIDLTAVVWITNPDNDGNRYLLPFFFCPKATIDRRSKEDRVPYRYWMDAGYLIATQGNTIDYAVIKKTILERAKKYNTTRMEFDKWNAEQLRNEIQEAGVETSFFSQAISVISYPTKQFEKEVYDGTIKHSGHPILSWCLSGCVAITDANENTKIHKGKSHTGVKRVDGIIAAIMALGGSLTPDTVTDQSQYNNPDVPITFGIE